MKDRPTLALVALVIFGLGFWAGTAYQQDQAAASTPTPVVFQIPSPVPVACMPSQTQYPGAFHGHYNGVACVPD